VRLTFSILLLLLIALQARLWAGHGSLNELWRLEDTLAEQRQTNAGLRERNQALEAEVRDLKSGLEAVEERARSELGMTRPGEVFYQVVEEP
jgi:cell division protein FtsB